MKQLHILYVLHGFPPETWAGTEVYTLELAREMVARGHRVTILARSAEPGDTDPERAEFEVREETFEGLRVLRLFHRLDYANLRETYDEPRAVRAFREVLLRERPDLVHFQHLLHLSAGLVHEAQAFNLPAIVHCHDYWALCARVQLIRPDGGLCNSNRGAACFLCVREERLDAVDEFERFGIADPEGLAALAAGEAEGPLSGAQPTTWDGLADMLARDEFVTGAYAAADLLISPSEFLRTTLLASGRFDAERFVFSDNGLRTDSIQALPKTRDDGGRVRVGFVGSLVWYKGVELLLEAMGLVRDVELELHIHGAFDPENDSHHAVLAELAGDNTTFHGRFDNSRVSEVYRGLDVLVVPSLWFENSPITIHEAFLTRTPVVTANIGGMAEYVRDGVDGLHFTAGDASSLAAALRRLATEPGIVDALSQEFPPIKSIGANAIETEQHYEELLAQPREWRPLLFYDLSAQETSERRGPAESQGEDMLLLRPGASADYRLDLAGGGARFVELKVVGLADEPQLALGGRVLVNGRVVGRLPQRSSGGADGSWTVRIEANFPTGDVRVTVDSRAGLLGRAGFLRIRRLTVREDVSGGARASWWRSPKSLFRRQVGAQDV